jgi:hypothetical protein
MLHRADGLFISLRARLIVVTAPSRVPKIVTYVSGVMGAHQKGG